tara:strand:- start:326 stop:835 length:510 start_codon:yes stop_codon:yes gene_type:complete
MTITLNGTTGITTPDITSTTSTLGALTQALDLGSTGQIVFPATQSASANANTLDDYEEGTWSVTVGNGANTSTLSNNYAYYTKIGNQVILQGSVNATVVTANILTYISLGAGPFAPTQSSIGSCFANNNIRTGNIQIISGQTYIFFGIDSQLPSGAEIFQYSITYTTSS